MAFAYLVSFASFVVFVILDTKVRFPLSGKCCKKQVNHLPKYQQRDWHESVISAVYSFLVPPLAIAYLAWWLSSCEGPFSVVRLVQRSIQPDSIPYLSYLVEIALGFLAVETRSLTLNIHVPSSGFWYHVLATGLCCVSVWTGYGLVVALILIASQFTNGIMNVMWLSSRSRWLGCAHIVFFILFVPFFILLRVFCFAAAAVLAWSLLLNAITVESIAPWSAYALMATLCAFFVCHAVWTCEMVASAVVDLTGYSTLANQLTGRMIRDGVGSIQGESHEDSPLVHREEKSVDELDVNKDETPEIDEQQKKQQ